MFTRPHHFWVVADHCPYNWDYNFLFVLILINLICAPLRCHLCIRIGRDSIIFATPSCYCILLKHFIFTFLHESVEFIYIDYNKEVSISSLSSLFLLLTFTQKWAFSDSLFSLLYLILRCFCFCHWWCFYVLFSCFSNFLGIARVVLFIPSLFSLSLVFVYFLPVCSVKVCIPIYCLFKSTKTF